MKTSCAAKCSRTLLQNVWLIGSLIALLLPAPQARAWFWEDMPPAAQRELAEDRTERDSEDEGDEEDEGPESLWDWESMPPGVVGMEGE